MVSVVVPHGHLEIPAHRASWVFEVGAAGGLITDVVSGVGTNVWGTIGFKN